MKILVRSMIFVICAQLAGAPVVFAQAGGQVSRQSVTEKAIAGFDLARERGWSFMDQSQKEVKSADLIKAAVQERKFYAVSPYLEDIKTRVMVRVELTTPTLDSMGFKLAILDRTNTRELSARKFNIDMDPNKAEESKLRFARTVNSMVAEIQSETNSRELASVGAKSQLAKALGSLFVGEAQASGMANTAKMLETVASGACTIGFLMLIFAGSALTEKVSGKTRVTAYGWMTIAAFVIGGAAYIASGIAADAR